MKKILSIVLSVFLAAALTACGGGSAPTPVAPATPSAPASSASAPADNPGEEQQFRVAFSLPPIRNDFHARMRVVIDEAITQQPANFEFVPINAIDENDQLNQLEIFRNEGFDLIAIMPSDAPLLAPIIEEIYNSGIPVIIINRAIPSDTYTHFIAGDNPGGGRLAAQHIGEVLGGEGDIVMLRMGVGTPIDTDRHNGFMEVMEQSFPNINIMGDIGSAPTREAGLESMANALQAYPHIDAVYTHDDEMALGALTAIEQAGRTDIKIMTGFGGTRTVFEMYAENNPDLVLKGTALYSPMMGADAVRLAVDVLNGVSHPKDIIQPSIFVTRENIQQFMEYGY